MVGLGVVANLWKPIEFRFLRLSQRWHSTTANNAIPNGFNQFDLLVNVEYTSLLQELSVHYLDSIQKQYGNSSAHHSLMSNPKSAIKI